MSKVFRVSLIRIFLLGSLSLLFLLAAIVWLVPDLVNTYVAVGWSGLEDEQGLGFLLFGPIGLIALGWWSCHIVLMYLDKGLAVNENGMQSAYLLGNYKNVAWSDVLEVVEKRDPTRKTNMRRIVIYLKNTKEMYSQLPWWVRWYHINPLHITIATTMYQTSHKEIFETLFQHHQNYLEKQGPKNESNLI